MIYHWKKQGRRPATFVLVVSIWSVMAFLHLILGATWIITACIGLLTFPAVFDLLRNPQTSFEIWPNRLVWRSSFISGDVNDIDHLRLDRRFDGAMKITIIHLGGAQTRLPPDVTPPPNKIEPALKEAGITVQRNPFSPF